MGDGTQTVFRWMVYSCIGTVYLNNIDNKTEDISSTECIENQIECTLQEPYQQHQLVKDTLQLDTTQYFIGSYQPISKQ